MQSFDTLDGILHNVKALGAETAAIVLDTQVPKMPVEELTRLALLYAHRALVDQIRALTLSAEREASNTPEARSRAARNSMPYIGSKAWLKWAEKNPQEAEKLRDRRAEEMQHLAEHDAKLEEELRHKFQQIANDWKAQLKIEWTAELLSSEFALGDGTSITWGEASIEQHESRMKMHAANARAGLDGQARHALAIDAIRQSGASTLNEVVS